MFVEFSSFFLSHSVQGAMPDAVGFIRMIHICGLQAPSELRTVGDGRHGCKCIYEERNRSV